MDENSFRVGRSGSIAGHALSVELRGEISTSLHRVVGLKFNLGYEWIIGGEIDPDRSHTSNGGNGFAAWDNLSPGVYLVKGAVWGFRKFDDRVVVIGPEGVTDVVEYSSETRSTYAKHLPGYLSIEQAVGVMKEVAEERRAFSEVDIDGFAVYPVFNDRVDFVSIAGSEDRDEKIVLAGMPIRWEVSNGRRTFDGSTPEKAVEAMKQHEAAVQAEIKAKNEAAAKESAELGLPALKGTPKQVAWATTIRAAIARKDPKDSGLRRASKASYWIDRRYEV